MKPAVGSKTFKNWTDAIRYAKNLSDAGKISQREYQTVALHGTASIDDAGAYIAIRREQERT
jgi:hypothetical protein